MNIRKPFLFLALGLCSLSLFSQKNSGQIKLKDGVYTGVVRVKFSEEGTKTIEVSPALISPGSAKRLETTIGPLDKITKQIKATRMERVFPYNAKRDADHREFGLHLWYDIYYDASKGPEKVISDMADIDEIIYAQPIYEIKLDRYSKGERLTAPPKAATQASRPAEMPFNDIFLNRQWHYNNNGMIPKNSGGGNYTENIAEGADINLFEAWKTTTGHPDVIVCIVDGGIDTKHEDLKDNMWINEAEANGTKGVDDDGNGYVDDINGYNFVKDSGVIIPHEHGTHVAGTVAAVNNNGKGVSGVAGGDGTPNSGAKLMSAQIFTPENDNGVSVTNLARAMVYGADNGAVISQNSWGFTNAESLPGDMRTAIDYFIAKAGNYENSPMQGGIVIFSAGNEDESKAKFPASDSAVLAVSSFRPDFKKAYYSNYAAWVDIAAPGGDVSLATEYGVVSTAPDNEYYYMQGTSMACPHVSGVAALIIAANTGAGFTADMLKETLLYSVNDIDQYNPSYAGRLGAGYIDAAKSIIRPPAIAPDAITDLVCEKSFNDFAILQWTAPEDEDDGSPVKYRIYSSISAITKDNIGELHYLETAGGAAAGSQVTYRVEGLTAETYYYHCVLALDRWGNVSDISNIAEALTLRNEAPDVICDHSGDISLTETQSLTLNFTVNDPEGMAWTANLTDGSRGLMAMTQNPDEVKIVITTDYLDKGKYESILTITDEEGETAVINISFTVVKNNRAPEMLRPVQDIYFAGRNNWLAIDLSKYFADPDSDPITYSVKLIEGSQSATATITGSTLRVSFSKQGAGLYQLTCKDSDGAIINRNFNVVAVEQEKDKILSYPNPAKTELNLQLPPEIYGTLKISLLSSGGRTVYKNEVNIGASEPVKIDVAGMTRGVYVVQVIDGNNKSYSKKVSLQ